MNKAHAGRGTSGGGFAEVLGSAGIRVRFAGLLRLYWPYALGLMAVGYLLRTALPLPHIRPPHAGLALLGLAGLGWGTHDRLMQRFRSFVKGARGEERVARELALLPEGFCVVHGLSDVGTGDFDHVVVGAGGVALVETKNWSGPVTYVDGEILADGRLPSRSPVAQVRREASRLERRLREAGHGALCVQPVLCLASDSFESEALASDGLTVVNADSLCAVLLDALGSPRTGQPAVTGVVDTLREWLVREAP